MNNRSIIIFLCMFYILCMPLQGDTYDARDLALQKDYVSTSSNLPLNNNVSVRDQAKSGQANVVKMAGFVGMICAFYVAIARYFVYSLNSDLNKIGNEISALESNKVKLDGGLLGVISSINVIESCAKENQAAIEALTKELKFGGGNTFTLLAAIAKKQQDLASAKKDACNSRMKQKCKDLRDKYNDELAVEGTNIKKANEEITETTNILNHNVDKLSTAFSRLFKSQRGALNQLKRTISKTFVNRDSGKPRLVKFEGDLNRFSEKYIKFRTDYEKLLQKSL